MFVEMPEIYGCKEMTPNQQKAQEIVTKFNGDGACLSNTDETYLGTLIAAALDDVQQATHDRLVLRHAKDLVAAPSCAICGNLTGGRYNGKPCCYRHYEDGSAKSLDDGGIL